MANESTEVGILDPTAETTAPKTLFNSVAAFEIVNSLRPDLLTETPENLLVLNRIRDWLFSTTSIKEDAGICCDFGEHLMDAFVGLKILINENGLDGADAYIANARRSIRQKIGSSTEPY